MHTGTYGVPPVRKRVVYLDQFAVSNLMLASQPDLEPSKRERIAPFWFDLGKRLDRLRWLQAIACPDSEFHMYESLASRNREALKRAYEAISGGLTFYSSDKIAREQLFVAARSWALGEKPDYDFRPESVIYGKLHSWTDLYYITASIPNPDEMLVELSSAREGAAQGLTEAFNSWRLQSEVSFDQRFNEEAGEYGKILFERHLEYSLRVTSVMNGVGAITPDLLFPPNSVLAYRVIEEGLRYAGLPDEEAFTGTIEFLRSDAIKMVPFNRISSMMWAALARQAATGRKRPPNRGMLSDVEMISTLLPYCDAMFVDRECYGLLRDHPLGALQEEFDTRIFSLGDPGGFIEYLGAIEAGVPREVAGLASDMFGARVPAAE